MTVSYNLKHKFATAVRKQLISRPIRDRNEYSGAGPVVVAGLFSTGSGIGQSARSCYRALVEAGIECLALDLSPKFNQVDLICDIPTIDAVPPNREGTIILHLNGPETQHGLYQAGLLLGRKWRVIGYWAWELLEPPVGWASAAQHLTEIWTPSEFVKASIGPIVDIPVRVVPHYVSAPFRNGAESEHRPLDNGGLKFLTMADGFSSFHRKNIFGAIDAYKRAFPMGTANRLVIKCRNLENYANTHSAIKREIESRDDIELISQTLLERDIWALLQSSDVVISLHRAEGFGLHLAEAMALGKVVVGTNWSGNLSFMTPDNSVLISSELVALKDPTGVYGQFEGALWAEANIQEAGEKLKHLSDDPLLRENLGKKARLDISSHLSMFRYVEALRSVPESNLDTVLPCVAE